jgi:hypothetical protein
MSHNDQNSRRWVLAVAALAVTMAFVAAAPAAAKGPVVDPIGCPQSGSGAWAPVRTACERGPAAHNRTAGERNSSDTSAGAIFAGSLVVVMLAIAGGLLVATHRRDAQGRHATALSGAGRT